MSISNTSSQPSVNQEPTTREEWQQKFTSFFDQLRASSGSRRETTQNVMNKLRQLQQEYKSFLQSPASNHSYNVENMPQVLEVCYQALDELDAPDQMEAAMEDKQKQDEAKKFLKNFTKKYQKTEELRAREEELKKNPDGKMVQKSLQNAKLVQELRKRFANQSRQLQTQQQDVEVEQDVKMRLNNLVKAPKAVQAQPKAEKPNAPILQQSAETKAPAQKGKTVPGKEGKGFNETKMPAKGKDAKGLEAKDKKTTDEKTQKTDDKNVDGKKEKSLKKVAPEDVESAKKAVEEALETGALVANAASHLLLDPARDVIKTLRKIDADLNELLQDDESEGSDTANGAARFAKVRDAIRNSKVKLFTALRDGNLRNGETELVEEEVARVARSGKNVATGEASQSTTSKSSSEKEQLSPKDRLRVLVGDEIKEFSDLNDVENKVRYFRHWKPLENVVSYVQRQHKSEFRG